MAGRLWGLVLLVAAFALDQASKAAVVGHFAGRYLKREDILPFFRLALTENPGISFGLLNSGARWGWLALSLLQVALVAALFYLFWRARGIWSQCGFGLIIGGAAGNLADRVRLGHVVDFLDVHWGDWTPFIFNGADAAISVGVCCLVLDSLLGSGKSPR